MSEALRIINADLRQAVMNTQSRKDYLQAGSTSVKYMVDGFLGCNDEVTFGFFDPGRSGVKVYGIHDRPERYLPAVRGREVLLVRSPERLSLEKLRGELHVMEKYDRSWEERIKHISMRIAARTANHDQAPGKFEGVVSIFDVRGGCCRHVSLMFKWACDALGYKCCLIRGDVFGDVPEPHCWNVVVSPSDEVYVIDVLNAPQGLYTLNDVKNGVDKIGLAARDGLKLVMRFRRIGGGIGHSVVRVASSSAK